VDVELHDVTVVAGKDVAVDLGLERFKGKLKSGNVTHIWARFTSVFRKIDGEWRDVRDRDSVPIGFAVGKTVLDLKP
jgi:ketosteroid isomerase-like protein